MPKKKQWQWLDVDHITYAVWDIQYWRAVYMGDLGFREIHHTPDASPKGKSSMELYGLQNGRSRIALARPINRSSLSHLEVFLRMHGDHSVQHVAYGIKNIEAFVQEMEGRGFHFIGTIKQRTDQFGPIKQIFAKKFDENLTPAQGFFYEFVQRRKQTDKRGVADFFSSLVAEELYEELEDEQGKSAGANDCFLRGLRKSY